MSAFKEQLERDIDAIFLNPEEFGETHVIDGKEMTVVIDSHKLAELKAKAQYADAIYTASLLVFVKPKDLGYRPAVDSFLEVDGRDYRVMQVSGELLYQLILEANR